MSRIRALGRTLAALAVELLLLRWMVRLGSRHDLDVADLLRGLLDGSPLHLTTEPLDVAAVISARICTVLIAYLVLVTVLHATGLLAGSIPTTRRLGAAVTKLATAMGPRRLAAFATVAAVVGTQAGCAPGAASRLDVASGGRGAARPATMVLEGPSDTTTTTETAPTATMVLDPTAGAPEATHPPPGTQPTTQMPAPAPPDRTTIRTPPPAAAPEAPTDPARIVVVPGDSLWSIAERTTSTRLGHRARDHETAPYWRTLIEANRHRLVDPSDPDLIHPGQELLLP